MENGISIQDYVAYMYYLDSRTRQYQFLALPLQEKRQKINQSAHWSEGVRVQKKVGKPNQSVRQSEKL